jgi:predicted Zn-dependent protease
LAALVLALSLWGVPGSAQAQANPGLSGGASAPPSASAGVNDEERPEANSGPAVATPTPVPISPTVSPRIPVATPKPAHPIKTEGKYDVTKIGERNIGGGLNLYSIAREREMGKAMAAEVESEVRLVKDPVITEYVNRIGQNIVRHSDAKVPFTIKVIDDDQVNAFALPGGYFYVNTGLILAAENEAELAGVMAHEIAHVAARHATKTQTRMQIINLASIPLIFVGGPAGFAVREAMGLAVPMGFLKFTRDEEREADLLGVEYEYAAGYDPAEFVHFFETLKSREKEKKHGKKAFIAKAFSTHPMTDDRIRRAQKEIQTMLPPKEEYIVDTSEFDSVKARLAGIENRNRIDDGDPDRPTLRRREPVEKIGNKTASNGNSDENQDRPTLKRKTEQ